MTEKELNSLYSLNVRIKRLKKRINEIEQDINPKGINYTGTPRSPNPTNQLESLVIKRIELLDKLNKSLKKAVDEEIKIRRYIDSVEDEEIKEIMELRFIFRLNWYDIGVEMAMERTTASKKMRRYIAEH